MGCLTNQDVESMGKAVGLPLAGLELQRVADGLNAILELMAEIEVPGANLVEPLPSPWARQEDGDE